MRCRNRFTSLLMILLMGVSVLISPFFIVKAETNPILTISGVEAKERTELEKACNDINIAVQDWMGMSDLQFMKFDAVSGEDTYNIEINMSSYSNWGQEDKQEVMSICLNKIDKSGCSRIIRSKVYNFIANNDKSTSSLVRQLSDDVTSDFAGAYSYFKPWAGWLGILLGGITLLIFLTLTLGILFDISYIVIPMWQNFLSADKADQKPKFISLEAWNAVKKAEESTTSGFREPLGIYLGSKTRQFIAIGVCILYLVSGKIYNLIAWLMDSFSGVLPD